MRLPLLRMGRLWGRCTDRWRSGNESGFGRTHHDFRLARRDALTRLYGAIPPARFAAMNATSVKSEHIRTLRRAGEVHSIPASRPQRYGGDAKINVRGFARTVHNRQPRLAAHNFDQPHHKANAQS